MREIAGRQKLHLVGCAWFWAWAVVGAGVALGMVSLGPLLLLPLAVIVWLMTRKRPIRGAFGLFSGVGALLLVVAYLQRQGPGTTCWQTATGGGCEEHLDPIPWLVAGIAFFTAGLVGHAWRSARP